VDTEHGFLRNLKAILVGLRKGSENGMFARLGRRGGAVNKAYDAGGQKASYLAESVVSTQSVGFLV
jgi:hypothetical protein